MAEYISYFDATYITGIRARGRRAAMAARYPIQIWNQYDAALEGKAKTNISEGCHKRLILLLFARCRKIRATWKLPSWICHEGGGSKLRRKRNGLRSKHVSNGLYWTSIVISLCVICKLFLIQLYCDICGIVYNTCYNFRKVLYLLNFSEK